MLKAQTPQPSARQPKFASDSRTPLAGKDEEILLSPIRDDFTPSAEAQIPLYTKPKQPVTVTYYTKAWTPEIIWCLLTIGILIAIVAVLRHFDGKPMPQWPMDLTLNTLLAFLATICRSMTIIPLAEAISQLKWNWFANCERPLNDMYNFDQASRGPWGAVMLIVKARGRFFYFTWVAAIVFLSGLITSFVTQSAISYQSTFAVTEKAVASAPILRSYPDSFTVDDPSQKVEYYISYGMTRSSFQAGTYTVNESWPLPQPTCSEIRCEWPQYNSLGMCASISNVTDRLNVTEIPNEGDKPDYNASLPGDLGYLYWKALPGVTSNLQAEFPIQLNITSPLSARVRLPIAEEIKRPLKDRWNSLGQWNIDDLLPATISQAFFIFSNGNPDPSKKFRAVELLWHVCVHTYESSFANGTASTNTTAHTVKINEMRPSQGSQYASFLMANEHGNSTFNVTANYFVFHTLQANLIFQPSYSTYIMTGGSSSGGGVAGMYGHNLGLNVFSSLQSGSPDEEIDEKSWKNINKMTNTVADGMTAFMRNGDKEGKATGIAYKSETYVRIRWEWLTFLAAQICLTILFLVAVIVQTAKLDMEVVKSSNMAELFAIHATDSKDDRATASYDQAVRYKGIATKIHHASTGKLVKKGDGWHYITTSS
ncbi:unnamed protein product [Clonostachys byssicola]|uniref:Uncharacterized protein n=1 Tax=Clonostachys byssicola TaxID=160290 RepID=A0A9N9U8I8_9HYPO|nr:unnamed protein product [Clonostachys byssicola]